jgi:glycosyltransferase involved in cell wall biosynthesis
MKIVHVVYNMEMGGAEMLVAQLCRMQRAHGHEVSICAYSTIGSVGEVLREEGFSIYVPGEAHPAKTMLRYFRFFRQLRPDVVHCHNPAPTLQGALGARMAGVRRILSTRHSLVAPPYDRAEELKYSVLSAFCDWIVGICEITCENLRGAPGAHRGKIVRVYNGASAIVPAANSGTSSDRCRLLFVGRLAAVKDLATLLHAVALAVPDVAQLQLSIIGDGPMRASLETLAVELGITNHVRFHGQQLETAGYFSSTDLFVMSSISEGLPMSLLQAMSVGLPAITTDVGGMAEVLRLSDSGLLVPAGDASAYAKAIVRLAQDGELRDRLGSNARTAYEEHFTLKRMDAAYMALYA